MLSDPKRLKSGWPAMAGEIAGAAVALWKELGSSDIEAPILYMYVFEEEAPARRAPTVWDVVVMIEWPRLPTVWPVSPVLMLAPILATVAPMKGK